MEGKTYFTSIIVEIYKLGVKSYIVGIVSG
jgi:hypothetical protein